MRRPRIGRRPGVGVGATDGIERLHAPSGRRLGLAHRDAQQSLRRVIDQGICVLDVRSIRIGEGRVSDLVNPGHELGGAGRTSELVEETVERHVGRDLQRRRGMAHLSDADPQRIHMLGTLPLMQCEGAFDLPYRLRSQVRDERSHEPALHPMKAQQASNVVIDREADTRSLRICGDAGELGDLVQGVNGHT